MIFKQGEKGVYSADTRSQSTKEKLAPRQKTMDHALAGACKS